MVMVTLKTKEMGQWDEDENGMPLINGMRGITLVPGNDPEVPNSTNDNVQIVLNERLDHTGLAKIVGHIGNLLSHLHGRGHLVALVFTNHGTGGPHRIAQVVAIKAFFLA